MESAVCAKHPEVTAAETCARCGSFMCGECRAEETPAYCRDCARRLDEGRLVRQVPVLGIVMMVHGAFTAALGLYYLVFGGFFVSSLSEGAPAETGSVDELLPGILLGGFSILGLLQLVPGILQGAAGWYVRTYRGRALGITALAIGCVSCLGFYCIPSMLALLIWGLIVLLDDDVSARFAATPTSGR